MHNFDAAGRNANTYNIASPNAEVRGHAEAAPSNQVFIDSSIIDGIRRADAGVESALQSARRNAWSCNPEAGNTESYPRTKRSSCL